MARDDYIRNMKFPRRLRYFFPVGSKQALAVYGLIFSLVVAGIYFLHPETRGGPSVLVVFIIFGVLFGVYAFISRFHPEWGNWTDTAKVSASSAVAGARVEAMAAVAMVAERAAKVQ